jgi:hypothetical protein
MVNRERFRACHGQGNLMGNPNFILEANYNAISIGQQIYLVILILLAEE